MNHEVMSGCVNHPKTLGQCARDFGTVLGQCARDFDTVFGQSRD